MLSNLNRKKQIYDRRPEDHPMYADEWTKFWEMRYREVQESGDDPETHDYKADWIPFWGKRVDSIFEEELTSKTRDLLSQFGLSNTDEPKREDFPSKEGGKKYFGEKSVQTPSVTCADVNALCSTIEAEKSAI